MSRNTVIIITVFLLLLLAVFMYACVLAGAREDELMERARKKREAEADNRRYEE